MSFICKTSDFEKQKGQIEGKCHLLPKSAVWAGGMIPTKKENFGDKVGKPGALQSTPRLGLGKKRELRLRERVSGHSERGQEEIGKQEKPQGNRSSESNKHFSSSLSATIQRSGLGEVTNRQTPARDLYTQGQLLLKDSYKGSLLISQP